jgi:hypothetical protein
LNRSFPDTDCYIVTYAGGSAGALITTLLGSLVLDKKIDCEPADCGNSHDGLAIAEATWDLTSKSKYREQVEGAHLHVNPADPKSPIILFDHELVDDYKTLATVYPKFKQIIITFDDIDYPQICYNLFIKFTCQYFREDNDQCWPLRRQEFLANKPEETWINQYDDPNELFKNKEHLKRYVAVMMSKSDIPLLKNQYFLNEDIVGEFKKQVFCIKFSDIMKNPEIILSQLATITKKAITTDIKKYYDDWLKKQEFIEDVLPT